MNATTKLCAIFGNPVEHSLSPVMHNAAYKKLGLNFAYLAFTVHDLEPAIKAILSLGIRGVSITIPHKIQAMQFVDTLEKEAQVIGAINTIVNNNGQLVGSNTDVAGAMRALEEVTTLKGKKVVLLGAGGAAKAIAYGLKQKGADILILNRTADRAIILAKRIGCSGGDLSKLPKIASADILINATAIGLHPNNNTSLVPQELLHKNLVVFDIVYTPKETRLLQNAKLAGCTVIYGYKMLLYQAVAQFELFTGKKTPVAEMEQILIQNLK